MVRLGIVVPCYNEQDVLEETARRLIAQLERLHAKGLVDASSAVYFVDDGSRDGSWEIIQRLAADPRLRGIRLSRNRGHQNALLAGLMNAEGDALISVDADLQDDLNVMEDMVRLYLDGHDVVYGVRSDRTADRPFKRLTAESYYRLLRALGVEVVFNHADYRLLSRRAVTALASYREVNLFLRGIIPQLGFRTATVTYVRGERLAGESKYPLRKMLSLAVEGVISFSAAPLRAITALGFLVCFGSFAMAAWALLARLFTDAALPGWASTVVPMYFLGGVQLLCLGVLGEYLAKIYMEVKGRPRYLIDTVVGGPNGNLVASAAPCAEQGAAGPTTSRAVTD
ncbi:MAG: glycosyltransferase family 2 protein [Sutterellaceae bacterium]|nr:glycosyltransferase family 2 protein [Burkholderiaceae bacterium]MDW8429687.1 glycosyltransferase family 2 protein [Sutterellaceae bacterium]